MITEEINKINKKSFFNWLIWGSLTLYYFYEICLRMLPGTMPGFTMSHFHIDAAQLGMFTASYYWAYTLMQIPAGIAVDRFSVKKIILLAMLFCIFGLLISELTTSLIIAYIGRFIIGLASAFAYVSCLKAAAEILPKRSFGLATCMLDSIGMLGAIFTSIIITRLGTYLNYPTFIYTISLIGLFCIAIIFFSVRKVKFKNQYQTIRKDELKNILISTRKTLKNIVKSKQLWLLGIIGALFYLPSSVIGDVWGQPYLQSAYHLSKNNAANLMGIFFLSWAIAGPLIGAYSDKVKKRKTIITNSLIILFISLSIVILLPNIFSMQIPYLILVSLFIIIGAATSSHPLIFALAKESFSEKHSGIIIATTNMLIMLGGLIFQPLIGVILDFTHGTKVSNIHLYNNHDFSIAFAIIPLSLILSLFLMNHVSKSQISIQKNKESFIEKTKKALELTLTESEYS